MVERDYSKASLLNIRNIVSTMFLAEVYYDRDLLLHELETVFEHEHDRQAASLLLNWLAQLWEHGRIPPEDFQEYRHVYTNAKEARTMLLHAIENEHKQFRQEGIQQGIQQGVRQGKLDDARRMLAKGLALPLILDITQLSETEIRQLQEEHEHTPS